LYKDNGYIVELVEQGVELACAKKTIVMANKIARFGDLNPFFIYLF
jgi:hypothetical protein